MTFTAWTGKLAFGPWWLLRGGPIGPTEAHAHHAFQIVVYGGAPCITDGAGEPVPGPFAVIAPEQKHTIHSQREHALVVYVEPHSSVGQLLRGHAALTKPLPGRGHPVGEILGSLLPTNWSRVDEAVRRTLAYLGVPQPGESLFWWRHPELDETLTKLADATGEGDVDLAATGASGGLAASRLERFPSEIGIPLGAYAPWLRLVRATEHLVDGASMDEAAQAAHFTDAAHLDRATKEMFGLPALELASAGTWIR